MSLNTYPCNPFPPSTDQMDADTLEANVSKLETDVDQLKSGLTNYQAQNDLNLEVPNRKNILAYTLESLKSGNTQGTWSGNDYTREGVVFSVATDASGNVASITADGQATSDNAIMFLYNGDMSSCAGAILSGAPVSTDMMLKIGRSTSPYTSYAEDNGSGAVIANGVKDYNARAFIKVNNGKTADNAVFTPMVRPAFITDSTFAPYIPSVESRIEAVESKLIFTSATTGTMKAKLNSIQPYFNTLSDEQKRHAYLVHNNNVLFIENTYGARFGSAVRYAESNSKIIFYIVQLNASDSSYVVPSIDTSGFTLEDRSSEENANAVSLYIN